MLIWVAIGLGVFGVLCAVAVWALMQAEGMVEEIEEGD